MSIRTIRKAGKIVGYQAIGGSGGAGQSAYFGVATHGDEKAMELAQERADELEAEHTAAPRPAQQGNAGGIPGLQLVYQQANPPILYAAATFRKDGRNARRAYSTQVHGKEGAVALAMAAREHGAGVQIGMTPREVLAVLEAQLAGEQQANKEPKK